ncbi:putative phosphoesterase, ICC [Mycobacteroides abscessus subsp. abscessus]|uniref:metallophosphoesterase family protein n=1 Tax=Mycobacteroides abscessus TaxID=36809 RepID=UPI0009A85AF9|nr:metallophosphoesterase family protein [Mycobacteroides abscessus]SKO34461.1 putative phosphoesterase, ICC [Mycobacteroides abscessus subsp. abscessus]
MRLLLIADTEPLLKPSLQQYVSDRKIDAVITVGDLYAFDLNGIEECCVPAMGVYGNHCSPDYLERLGMINLHRNRVMLGGLSFTGMEGCVRYNEYSRAVAYTQEEYAAMITDLEPADILVTHCPPRGINDGPDRAHIGIDALRTWIDENQPQVLIHGHTYPQNPITQHGATRIVYVHGTRILTVPEG